MIQEMLASKQGAKRYFLKDANGIEREKNFRHFFGERPDVRLACQRLIGAYAIAVIDERQPGKVVVSREGSPLRTRSKSLGLPSEPEVNNTTAASSGEPDNSKLRGK